MNYIKDTIKVIKKGDRKKSKKVRLCITVKAYLKEKNIVDMDNKIGLIEENASILSAKFGVEKKLINGSLGTIQKFKYNIIKKAIKRIRKELV